MLFSKTVVFTDAHHGRSGNSQVANQDNLDFYEWAIDRAKSWGATTCIFMGDFFDNRNNIGLLTLDYAFQGMETISKGFDKVFILTGNHDQFFRENRSITSIKHFQHLPNISLINEPLTVDNVTFLPWLNPDEHNSIGKHKSRYVFGHLEMPGFKMNAAVVLPDAPHLLKAEGFNQEFVFSGHFHARQHKKMLNGTNIVYTGNIMPFNFSDAWDEDRGIMLLEWGCDPIFESWPDQPVFRTAKLSELLADPGKILKAKATIRATVDVTLHFEEAQEIRNVLESEYSVRKLELINASEQTESDQEYKNARIEYKSVDQMVIEGILSVESNDISPERLVEMYRNLI